MTKQKTISILTILLAIIFVVILVLPMTSVDIMSYLLHDSRWWLNQYWDWYNSFPNSSPIAISGYNNSGLAINLFYPNTILKILEIPLILLKIKNLYIVMGTMTILINLILGFFIYINTKALSFQKPWLVTITLVLFQNIPLNGGLTNSLPQQLATAFIYLGVYSIITARYEYMIISTILLINTSFTTSMIAALTYLAVLLILKKPFEAWLQIMFNGIIGLTACMPLLLNIFKNLHSVTRPSFQFNLTRSPWFFFSYFKHPDPTTIIAFSVRIIGPLLIIGFIYITYTKYVSRIIPIFLASIAIISSSPKVSAALTMPIQTGTWPRIWPIVVVVSMIALTQTNLKKYSSYMIAMSIVFLALISSNLNFVSFDNMKNTNYVAAIKSKNWNDAYKYVLTNLHLESTSGAVLIKSLPENVAPISPDYMPVTARTKDNVLVYSTPHQWKTKYGLEKHSVDHGSKLKITINPKHKVTPLGVWHYDFLKYNVSSTHGTVSVTNRDMFEYHGTKKTTIFISLKN